MPWTQGCDLLLAPYPAPGAETESLLRILDDLSRDFPVALYERDIPVWPNLLLKSGHEETSLDFADAAEGLRGFRSAFRHVGRGGAEAFQMLPAGRLALLLRGSWRAAFRPHRADHLQYRHHLDTALDYQRTLATMDLGAAPRPMSTVGKVAVVMPHFDDDVLQCGAAIAQAVAAGSEVRMIWLTDGGKGVSTVSEQESARIRHEEARRAMEILGVQDLHFLDAPETRLRRRGPWTSALRDLLADFRPDRIFTTWWADNNLDHYESNRVLQAAWTPELDEVEIAASGLWQPLPATQGVPIDDDLRALKDAALQAYPSQIREVDYLRVDRGLGCWYARESSATWMEAFWTLPAMDYWQAFSDSGAGKRLFLGG
jgi:LmbE family N-acetylglucosaminyl deacetylase